MRVCVFEDTRCALVGCFANFGASEVTVPCGSRVSAIFVRRCGSRRCGVSVDTEEASAGQNTLSAYLSMVTAGLLLSFSCPPSRNTHMQHTRTCSYIATLAGRAQPYTRRISHQPHTKYHIHRTRASHGSSLQGRPALIVLAHPQPHGLGASNVLALGRGLQRVGVGELKFGPRQG